MNWILIILLAAAAVSLSSCGADSPAPPVQNAAADAAPPAPAAPSNAGAALRRQAIDEAVTRVTLPPNPTRKDYWDYIQSLMPFCRAIENPTPRDLHVGRLARVDPKQIDLLIAVIDEQPVHVVAAINRMAGPDNRDAILNALEDHPELIEVVMDRGWLTPSLRPALGKKLESATAALPPMWIAALASYQNPADYAALIEYFVRGPHRDLTYEAIRDLPGIELEDAVRRAWLLAKRNPQEAAVMAPIASAWGHADAIGEGLSARGGAGHGR